MPILSQEEANTILDPEIEAYEGMKEDLLREHEGKYALVRGGKLVGIWDTREDALSAGYDRFGNVPFLVRRIVKVDEMVVIL